LSPSAEPPWIFSPKIRVHQCSSVVAFCIKINFVIELQSQ
jgi:hypothetical protein